MEKKQNHLRKSIFGFVADVDMEPWCLGGISVEMSLLSQYADLASRMIVLAGRLLSKLSPTCEILDIQLLTGLWSRY